MARLGSCLQSNDHRLYREGILSFYQIYHAFESTWATLLTSPLTPEHSFLLQTLSDPRLSRTPAIAADLEYLFAASPTPFHPTDPIPANRPEVAAFVAHIHQALTEKPHTLVAYAHSFYMAMFAGGKVLKRMIGMQEGFFPVHWPAGDEAEARLYATNMFTFPVDEEKLDALRTRFKEAMEVVEEGLDEEERDEIVAESRAIFKWNERMILELDAICAKIAPVKVDVPKIVVTRPEGEDFAGWLGRNKVPMAITTLICLFGAKKMFWS